MHEASSLMHPRNFYGIKTNKNRCLLVVIIRLDIRCTQARLHGPTEAIFVFSVLNFNLTIMFHILLGYNTRTKLHYRISNAEEICFLR